jgi:hypothetical protein
VSTCISAVQHIRRLRGGSQAQLLRASDGAYYVCKFLNNPQHPRVLANEMLATRLGHLLALSMPQIEIIDVSEWLIEHSADFRIDLAGSRIPCTPGRHCGSLYVEDPESSLVVDYLPDELLRSVSNINGLARTPAGRMRQETPLNLPIPHQRLQLRGGERANWRAQESLQPDRLR